MRMLPTAALTIAMIASAALVSAQGFLDRLENVLEAEARAAESAVPKPVVETAPGYLGLIAEEEFGAVRVEEVREATAADVAGLRRNDWIQLIGKRKVTTLDEMAEALAGRSAGERIEMTIRRDGEVLQIPVTLGVRGKAAVAVVDELPPAPEPTPAVADPGGDAVGALDELEKILDGAPPAEKPEVEPAKARDRRIDELEAQLSIMKRHIAELEKELAEIADDE